MTNPQRMMVLMVMVLAGCNSQEKRYFEKIDNISGKCEAYTSWRYNSADICQSYWLRKIHEDLSK